MNPTKIFSIVGIVVVMIGAYLLGSHTNTDMQVVAPNTHTVNSLEQANQARTESTASVQNNGKIYSYTEALQHIGENASITGSIVDVYTAKSGVTFLDFCKSYKTCPFTAVIFSSSLSKFPDIQSYTGEIIITGLIKSYQGKAEIIIDNPSQIKKN